jgi:TRAP-type C4-dicarboxylate transport system permease small subunit
MAEAGEGAGGRSFDNGPLVAITRPLAIAGGLLMLAVSCVVVVSVLMRWLINYSVPGDIELVQICTALAVFAFLPLCQAHRGNIMVDSFTNRLPARFQRMLDALWDLVYAGMMAIIAWRLALGAWDTIRSNTVSMMLALPIGWAIAACAVMAALLAAVAAGTALVLLRGRR